MNCTEGFRRLIVIIMATGFTLVAGNKQYNCSVRHHCSKKQEDTINRKIANEVLKPHGKGETRNPRVNHVKQKVMVKEENGFKRDNTFNEVLKNLFVMIDKAKPNAVTFPSVKPSVTSSIIPSSPADAFNVTATPTEATSTANSESVITPTLTPTTNVASASTPTSTPSTTVTPSTNISTTTEMKPGKNITVAPGIVIAPSGEIILNPHFPVSNGAGQTTAGGFPLPVSLIPGVIPPGTPSSGIFPLPGVPVAANVQQAAKKSCTNKYPHCMDWARQGECKKNIPFMTENCRRSCTNCAKCENGKDQCIEWAKNGECTKNWKFMEQTCWRSCSSCAPCQNMYPTKCIIWAKKGECNTNRKFMNKFCWKSCSSCAKCENKQSGCIQWAADGQCSKTHPYMMASCWKSCSFCAPCIDKHPKICPDWAKRGQCKKNRNFMEENCWKSCSKCCKDKSKHCPDWAKHGECANNPEFMTENCAMSCNKC